MPPVRYDDPWIQVGCTNSQFIENAEACTEIALAHLPDVRLTGGRWQVTTLLLKS